MPKKSREPFICPICGEDVPAGAKSCPECGACEKSGWSADADYDGLDFQEDYFDYERFSEEEFGEGAKKPTLPTLWLAVAALLLIATAFGLVGGCFHIGK
jgi:hypothetical protein